MVRSTDLTVSSIWVKRLGHLYLLIPFLVFCLGFMKTSLAIPITVLFLWLVIRDWRRKAREEQSFSLARHTLVYSILGVLLWVALSGIGGFAFQNSDFHIRNAIFHDLINYEWPVRYFSSVTHPSTPYNLTYYIGYWLPAALIGKLAGWRAANIALFLWTVTGILLVLLLLFSSKKSRPTYFLLLLVFFSGMDALGTLLSGLIRLPAGLGSSLWPPFMHLEWWMPGLQFSSLTTQLFWVFNQALPAWLCMALLWTAPDRRSTILIWSLCAFFAPLPALGMLPYLVLKIPNGQVDSGNLSDAKFHDFFKSPLAHLRHDLHSVLTAEDILGGGIVLLTSYLYFSANVNASHLAFTPTPPLPWPLYMAFILVEGLLVWWACKQNNQANPWWYLAGFLILVIPLVRVGSAQDFCTRASIPTLFMLMVWSAEMLQAPQSRMRAALIMLLAMGAITPIYEINRSVYRTANYLLNPPSQSQKMSGQEMRIYAIQSFEYDHPFTLTADSFKSLANIDPETIPNFVARTDSSLFYDYLGR